jgi:signal transduction histidine kinase
MPLAEVIAFWDEEDRARLQDGLARTERLGERLDFEGRTARRDDQVVRWWRLIGDPVIEHGRCVALRGAAVETTHWRETQARERSARKAADEMSGFLATMSHEIRTPLNGVLGMAQAMSHDDLSGLQRRRLEAIQTSGEALLSLLNDVLDMSCLEAGQVELEAGLVDPERLIDGARSVFSALARDKDIDLSLSVADDARGPWIGDPLRVRQVLHNLLSNAVKFTERGAIGVEFYQDGRQLSLRVRDSGVGIPQRLLGQVFEKFIQGDTGTTRRYGGSGLGLTITRDLVTMMGGEIGVESVEGRGSVFTVKLPLARAMAPAVAQLASPDRTDPAAVQSGPDDDGLRILAAEDNPTNRLVLKSLLEGVGYELVLVEDGKAAVEAWRDGVWDVILMDIQMPVMDGVTASKVIRDAERRLGRRRTPIVAVTANAMPHHQAQYLAAEMDAVVPKPLDLRKLLETMEAALQPPEARMHKLAC